jgi:hypothetical protein
MRKEGGAGRGRVGGGRGLEATVSGLRGFQSESPRKRRGPLAFGPGRFKSVQIRPADAGDAGFISAPLSSGAVFGSRILNGGVLLTGEGRRPPGDVFEPNFGFADRPLQGRRPRAHVLSQRTCLSQVLRRHRRRSGAASRASRDSSPWRTGSSACSSRATPSRWPAWRASGGASSV